MIGGRKTPEADGIVYDAYDGNWVDHRAPARLRPLLRLSRADRPIGTWLLLMPCFWGIALAANATGGFGWWDLWLVIGCTIGSFLMRGAGCTWNDITDRKFDAAVARTRSRPIPSGQISAKGALVWAVVQCLISLLILLTFNAAAIWLGVLSLVPVAVYPFAKRFTWWPQVFLGLAFNWGALLAWTAHTGSLGLPAVLLYVGGISWTLFYDTIYAHQDKEDDVLIGVKSTARLFAEKTPQYLLGFLVIATTLMVLAVLAALLPNGASGRQLLLCLCGPLVFAAHMGWQLWQLDIDNPDLCLKLFRRAQKAGLFAALFFAVGAIV
ncbi:4-hydroxybenzoate octaprenyltransferase [Thioclava sp. GXIMD4216]|uniref:4-hydroxybenzoate octaprenyltransferase n=1 Tax=Thioclava sp. GXIMD4216 TaxID=3131929 RepID=UPI0030D22ED9